jgi:BMFP domain-containing protein YqiC
MQTKEKILDDIARVAGGAASVVSGLAHQVREDVRARGEDLAARLDLIPREDFERLEARLDALLKRIETLEKKGQ